MRNVSPQETTSVAQRKSLASTSNDYYVPLWSFFKQTHMPLLYAKDDIQLRIFMDSATGTPVSTFNNLQVLLNVCKLENYDIKSKNIYCHFHENYQIFIKITHAFLELKLLNYFLVKR